MQYDAVLSIYDEGYARTYPAFYLYPWAKKHQLNVQNINRIIRQLSGTDPRWLDIGCGQGWHFSNFPSRYQKIGLDISMAQLTLAKRGNPDSSFVRADMSETVFADLSFDLVTCFWAAYCYLNDSGRIAALLQRAIDWTRKSGVIYWEVLLPNDLASFNDSGYARKTGFSVKPESSDYSEWSYSDSGGKHIMTSPPLALFTDILLSRFANVEAAHDGNFMVHVIAVGKK